MQPHEVKTETFNPRYAYSGPVRNGENGVIPPRSRRFHFNGHHWFFHTRERISYGPYDTFRQAEDALKLYLRRCGVVRYKQESRPAG